MGGVQTKLGWVKVVVGVETIFPTAKEEWDTLNIKFRNKFKVQYITYTMRESRKDKGISFKEGLRSGKMT